MALQAFVQEVPQFSIVSTTCLLLEPLKNMLSKSWILWGGQGVCAARFASW